jgi:hypothetical protein
MTRSGFAHEVAHPREIRGEVRTALHLHGGDDRITHGGVL